jgi:hypothetical protein
LRLNVTKADKKRFREKMKDSALSTLDEFRDLQMPETGSAGDEVYMYVCVCMYVCMYVGR